jgi:hypothetical protein
VSHEDFADTVSDWMQVRVAVRGYEILLHFCGQCSKSTNTIPDAESVIQAVKALRFPR